MSKLKRQGMLKPSAVIFDMDGTLVHVAHLDHLLDPLNLEEYHVLVKEAPPIPDVCRALHRWRALNSRILIVTARSDCYEADTLLWLDRHGLPVDLIYMRPEGDVRDDHLVKRDILAKVKSTHRVELAYEDKLSVADMYRNEGIPVHLIQSVV